MSDPLRFGILGTGNIAGQFARGVAGAKRSAVVAVASRAQDQADAFAKDHGITRAHGSYDALLNDDTVDAVYVSVPNSMHGEWTIRALQAGKHVLCEKPIAACAAEADRMFDAAAKADRLLVEAFMYRSHPLTKTVLDRVRGGDIGAVRLVRTSFCYRTRHIDGNIRFNRELAGGALMDIGCYCIDFARLMVGEEPSAVHAAGHLHNGGVDDLVAATMTFDRGAMASFTCGMRVQADNAAYICGSEGYIRIPVPWKPPVERAQYSLNRSTPPRMDNPKSGAPAAVPTESFHVDADRPLYALEADDFAAAVFDGVAAAIGRVDSLANMAILDAMRQQVGAII
jgi:predicted dehydrogenase